MNKQTIRNYAVMILGGLVIGFGVAFVVYGNLGGDAMTTFEQGMSVFFHMDLAIAQIIANGIFVVLLYLFARDRVNIDTILCPLFITLGCKAACLAIPYPTMIIPRVIYMIIGIVVVGLGIGIGAQTPSGSNPYDGAILALSEKMKINFSIMRPVCDGCLLVIGILLHGSWGIGTVAATFCTGYVANIFIRIFNNMRKA